MDIKRTTKSKKLEIENLSNKEPFNKGLRGDLQKINL